MLIGCYYDDGRALVAEFGRVCELIGKSEYLVRKALNYGKQIPGVTIVQVPKNTPLRIPADCKIR